VANRGVGYWWAPDLLRCPWSQIGPEVWDAVTWWIDWNSLGMVLPWGRDIHLAPAYVLEAVRICEAEAQRVRGEREKAEARKWRMSAKSA
jgi:hypothetical protein